MRRPFNVLVAGLGGQGIILLSKVIAQAAALAWPFVSKTEGRGLSQRGGEVASMIRFGSTPAAPIFGLGSCDMVISLDALEAARALPYLGSRSVLISNVHWKPPLHVDRSFSEAHKTSLSKQIMQSLEGTARSLLLDVSGIAGEVGFARGSNVALLGAASEFLPIPSHQLRECLKTLVKPEYRDSNLAVFDRGRLEGVLALERGNLVSR